MRILWSPLALERVEEISDYIAYDSPSAASRWVDAVLQKVELLKSSPEIGRMVPEVGAPSIREIVFGNYRIIYRLSDKTVAILTVRSFKQILPLDDLDASPPDDGPAVD